MREFLCGFSAALIGVSLQSINPFEPMIMPPQYWWMAAVMGWLMYIGYHYSLRPMYLKLRGMANE